MVSTEHKIEDSNTRVTQRSVWYKIKRLCQRYPLGAIGSFIVFWFKTDITYL